MAIIKCKMCGGDLELTDGMTVAECEYCGSKQTIPTVDNEKKLTLFSRANRLRFGCEFDKAAGVYEALVADFPEEAEAYWGLVLCKYGIEYVDDPATGKKIPTCHRSSFESVMDDSNLEQALENADVVARKLYREEAKQIEELRKGIIEVSGEEDPYDIFICYKESDVNGDRTLDSVLAQDVYDALISKGYRVFFSRITLEDKLGQEYEPYIFAALNSVKIMLVFGTDYEYFNAVWVKNEWSRYLQLMTRDKSRHLIPCYKGIDAYDMPKEFAKLQAQDMGRVGAVQDLLRGIEKLLPRKGVFVPQVVISRNATALVKRGMIYLEDGEFKKATEYFDRGLDENPEDSDAYLGKVMALLNVRSANELSKKAVDLADNKDFQRAVRYANPEQMEALSQIQRGNYISAITVALTKIASIHDKRVESINRIEDRYSLDKQEIIPEILEAGQRDEEQEERIVREFALPPYLKEATIRDAINFNFSYASKLSGWRERRDSINQILDSTALLDRIEKYGTNQTRTMAREALIRIRGAYDQAVLSEEKEDAVTVESIMESYRQYVKKCPEIRELRAKAEAEREEDYKQAEILFENGDYAEARELYFFCYNSNQDYRDVAFKIAECDRIMAEKRAAKEAERVRLEAEARAEAERQEAIRKRENALRVKRRKRKITILSGISMLAVITYFVFINFVLPPYLYKKATRLVAEEKYAEAYSIFYKLEDYKDSAAQCKKYWIYGCDVGNVVYFGHYEQDNNTDNGKEEIEWIVLDKNGNQAFIISKYVLDNQTYHYQEDSVTWYNCRMNTWLNSSFQYDAFSEAETQKITSTIGLLTVDEANEYFPSDSMRATSATPYAEKQGSAIFEDAGSYWWLRNSYGDTAPGVSSSGKVYEDIGEVQADMGVRPVLWIDLDMLIEDVAGNAPNSKRR